jgi:fengycin family lipopeptide synthetase D
MHQAIRAYCVAAGVSHFMFFLSAYCLLLRKVSGESDIVVGTDAAGRTHPDLQGVVGSFINVLPLRLRIGEHDAFGTFLEQVKNEVLTAFSHQDYPFDRLCADLGKGRNDQLTDVYFSHANFFDDSDPAGDPAFVPVRLGKVQGVARYELELNVFEGNGMIHLNFVYSPALYHRDTVVLLKKYYVSMLHKVLEGNPVSVKEIITGKTVEPAADAPPAPATKTEKLIYS